MFEAVTEAEELPCPSCGHVGKVRDRETQLCVECWRVVELQPAVHVQQLAGFLDFCDAHDISTLSSPAEIEGAAEDYLDGLGVDDDLTPPERPGRAG